MRANGELDVLHHEKIEANKKLSKLPETESKAFPITDPSDAVYPEHALKVGNPLYQTSSMQYGKPPGQADIPTKYFPRPPKFTETFLGGQFADTGLNTKATPSRVHGNYDN